MTLTEDLYSYYFGVWYNFNLAIYWCKCTLYIRLTDNLKLTINVINVKIEIPMLRRANSLFETCTCILSLCLDLFCSKFVKWYKSTRSQTLQCYLKLLHKMFISAITEHYILQLFGWPTGPPNLWQTNSQVPFFINVWPFFLVPHPWPLDGHSQTQIIPYFMNL